MTSLHDSPRVLVLHGIWNTGSWMLPLVRRLRRVGCHAESFGYGSLLGGPGREVPRLVERIRRDRITGVVGYSLGGLMALELLRRCPDVPVQRVVCLGSPLNGSATARRLRDLGAQFMLGRSAALLLGGVQPLEGAVAVGQVAGNRPRGIGCLLGAQGRDSDGTVGLDETRWSGLQDHCIVSATHTGLPFHAPAAQQVAHFLRHGQFAPP